METKYKIETGVPTPKRDNQPLVELVKKIFKELEVGQSFFIPIEDLKIQRHSKLKLIQSKLAYHLVSVIKLLKSDEKIKIGYATHIVIENNKPKGLRIWKINK